MEDRRSPEGVYRRSSSERYCGPVHVITLKQIVKTLYSIRALTGNQCSDRSRDWTWLPSLRHVVSGEVLAGTEIPERGKAGNYTSLHCQHQLNQDSCIKKGSNECQFNVSCAGRGRLYLALHCHLHNDSRIKIDSDKSHFNVSL